jgi:hypothetical protein
MGKIDIENIDLEDLSFEELKGQGFINEIAVRNLDLKKEYLRRISKSKIGESKGKIRLEMCEEFNISDGVLQGILYSKTSRKKGINFEIKRKNDEATT